MEPDYSFGFSSLHLILGGWVFWQLVYTPQPEMPLGDTRGCWTVLELLELSFHTAASHPVGARKQTRVLWTQRHLFRFFFGCCRYCFALLCFIWDRTLPYNFGSWVLRLQTGTILVWLWQCFKDDCGSRQKVSQRPMTIPLNLAKQASTITQHQELAGIARSVWESLPRSLRFFFFMFCQIPKCFINLLCMEKWGGRETFKFFGPTHPA